MARVTPYHRAILEGVRAAQREHQRLETTFLGRVEIFDIIEEQQIWLLFQKLQGLYGAYKRHGGVAGIIINSQHPLTLQRYTAAHEYGHHVLGHDASADDEDRIFSRGRQDLQEVAAQAFAGEFLMPLQLVNYTLRTLGLNGQNARLTPRNVYQLALEFGVSYSAAVWQLIAQRKLSASEGQRLRRRSPLALKTELAGMKPADSWADVWILDESQEGRDFSPRLRDEIHVLLPETPSSGYVWRLTDDGSPVLAPIQDGFQTDNDLVGSTGQRRLSFRVAAPGRAEIRLEKRRPWQGKAAPLATFGAKVNAVPHVTGEGDEGLSDGQKRAVLADVAA